MKTDLSSTAAAGPEAAVKTVTYTKRGPEGTSGRVSLRTLQEMIAHWEIGPGDFIRVEGEREERPVRECPALLPLDEMLRATSEKVAALRWPRASAPAPRRQDVIRELEMLRDYAERNDRVHAMASFLLGWMRYAENPALARGLFLRAIERGYPVTSVVRNNLAVAQIRLGEPAGRDNLILAANEANRTPAALHNLARLLQHLQSMGESTDEIASVKDLQRVARAEWRKSPPEPGEPASFALLLCDGDIPDSFASETRRVARIQGEIENILAEGEECLAQGRLEQALAHAARAASEIAAAREELTRGPQAKGVNPLRFLSVRLSRLEKSAAGEREARERQGQLDTFRSRLRGLEESLRLKVPPADLIQQAEILLDSARSEGEKAEARNLLGECHSRVARHLLETAGELLASGEKDVAVGLLRRAQALESDASDEIKLRLASLRRDELEKDIVASIQAGAFEEARAMIARLRSIHPIFDPLARRLEREADSSEAGALLDGVMRLLSGKSPGAEPAGRDAVLEARRLFEKARALSPDPAALGPIEAHLEGLAARLGLAPSPAPAGAGRDRASGPAPGGQAFVLEPSTHDPTTSRSP
ncbi:MAG: hypothetical protein HY721_11910 [Planctomycetes bacterium]|nr:hypothetical protein [Planctomycetota bacterium]